ncbi:MAG TPA: glucose-1-phosphate adenylyltransferase, partial [Burkholderiales bacterium]|nr:glucose-1-phosphate adenylyltransferase [Burkholderiales bacterium]
LAMVLAGGEGTRLAPLTAERSKPAVPFGGRYRIVDFVLSNLVNSGIFAIYLLVQYKSQSLIEHINRAWVLSGTLPDHFVTVVPPQMRQGPEWFQGTADAVHQNLNLIGNHEPALVAVFGADHVYRMDICQMVDFHRARDAQVSVAALPVPRADATAFGVIDCEYDGRIRGFLEKPANPPGMPGDPTRAFASMGNYLFDTDVLIGALREANLRGEHDFGKHVLPRLIGDHRVYAYDFATNRIPGLHDCEEPAYWRDVGTIDAYFAANQDVLGKQPRFDLFNAQWLVRSSNYQGPSSRVIDGSVRNSSLGAGTRIFGGSIRNSILRREVVVEPDVEIEDSIIMDYTVIRRGSRLRRTIVDRFNQIEANTHIGYDLDGDRRRWHVSPAGIVVLARGDPARLATV